MQAEEIAAKKKKACIKEGGKKGQDIAGVNDMGGLEFFCMNIDAPEGDFEYLKFVLEGANAHVEEGSEEDVDDVQVGEELEDWRRCFRRHRKGESRV